MPDLQRRDPAVRARRDPPRVPQLSVRVVSPQVDQAGSDQRWPSLPLLQALPYAAFRQRLGEMDVADPPQLGAKRKN